MKLELKHLSGYLPYGLRIDTSYYNDDQYDYSVSESIEHPIVTGYDNSLGVICQFSALIKQEYAIEHIKPILRLLSDLTKEIEINGKKFIPISEIQKINEDYYILESDGYIIRRKNPNTIFTGYLDCDSLPYWILKKLYEWHFDIHGLIDAGLAIDINTLTH